MDRPFGEFIGAVVAGTVAIFAVATTLLHRLRKRLLRRVNQQLDAILADSTIAKESNLTKNQ